MARMRRGAVGHDGQDVEEEKEEDEDARWTRLEAKEASEAISNTTYDNKSKGKVEKMIQSDFNQNSNPNN
jgi:hypothetical protein